MCYTFVLSNYLFKTKNNFMKTLKLHFKKISLMLFAIMLSSSSLFSASYTAVASGNWSSSTTWGVSAPNPNVTTDQIIIPLGITVTMTSNVNVSGALATMLVQGTLSSSSNYSLTIASLGNVSGTGTINVNSVVLNSGATLAFTGSLVANTVTYAATSLQVAADVVVNQTLNLTGGVFTLSSGGSLGLGSNGTISLSGGVLAVNGGTLGLSGNYNVSYQSGATISGAELNGSGLSNVTVNVSQGNTLTLSNDLVIDGTLTLSSGTIALNGNDLTINGNISSSGSGNISSTASSNISINTGSSTSGSLSFASSGNTVGNLTIDAGNGGSASVGSDLTVNGTLSLVNGNLNINGNSLNIGASGSISGAGSTSYIITGATGTLGMQLTAGASSATNFPVGTTLNFSPATVLLASGSASGAVDVGVASNVLASGTGGVDISSTQPVVDATWFVYSDITSNLNMTLGVTWASAMEVNGFSNTSAYISHYTNSAWDVSATSAATANGNGTFSLQKSGIASLSPFAVFNSGTATSVEEMNKNIRFDVYPNPASQNIHVTNFSNAEEEISVEITDIIGRVVGSYKITAAESDIPLTGMNNGEYFMRFYNEKMNVVKIVTKM